MKKSIQTLLVLVVLTGAPLFASADASDTDYALSEPSSASSESAEEFCALQCVEFIRHGKGHITALEDSRYFTFAGRKNFWDSYMVERENRGQTPLNDSTWQNSAFQVIAAKFPGFIGPLRLQRDQTRAYLVIDAKSKIAIDAFLTMSDCRASAERNARAVCSGVTTTQPNEVPPVLVEY